MELPMKSVAKQRCVAYPAFKCGAAGSEGSMPDGWAEMPRSCSLNLVYSLSVIHLEVPAELNEASRYSPVAHCVVALRTEYLQLGLSSRNFREREVLNSIVEDVSVEQAHCTKADACSCTATAYVAAPYTLALMLLPESSAILSFKNGKRRQVPESSGLMKSELLLLSTASRLSRSNSAVTFVACVATG
eukprot:303219-Pleurochrysis_carterae.AAC.1